MNRYQCPECKDFVVIASHQPKLKFVCTKCKKETEHDKFTGTITATNKPERAFISSFAEINIPAPSAPKTVEVKPAAPAVTKLDVKTAPVVKK